MSDIVDLSDPNEFTVAVYRNGSGRYIETKVNPEAMSEEVMGAIVAASIEALRRMPPGMVIKRIK